VDAGGAAPDVSLRRRPSWLLTRLLPGVAAVLALGCWALSLLPFFLAPLSQPPGPFVLTAPSAEQRAESHAEFTAAYAGDRFAPFRPGARAPLELAGSFAVWGCLFAANVWMLPRLTRLAPTVAGARDVWAVVVFLAVLAGTVALLALGYRPLLVTQRTAGAHLVEGYTNNGVDSIGFAIMWLWWIGCGGPLLCLDLALLAVAGLARFGLGGAKLLPRGQVATFENRKGLVVIKWLGGLSLACFLLMYAMPAAPRAVEDFFDRHHFLGGSLALVAGPGGLFLGVAFLLCVLWWMARYLLRDGGSPSPPPNAQSATMPPSVRLSASGAAPSAGSQAIRPGSEREGFGEPDRR
jgi:hypothetical protein